MTGDEQDAERKTLMERGAFSRPLRLGSEVQRSPGHDNASVHSLLRHFASVNCQLTPRFLGMAPNGAERLSFIVGDTGYPPLSADLRSNDALVSVARAIRIVHDASTDYRPPASATWRVNEIACPTRIDCMGHHDLAPWNIVFRGTQVFGIIDWDTAAPSNRICDLAYAAYQFVPFHPPDGLHSFGWPEVPNRRERLRLFLDAYDFGIAPAELVDAAVLRIYGMGSYIHREVAAGNSMFETHGRENHARGYYEAATFVQI